MIITSSDKRKAAKLGITPEQYILTIKAAEEQAAKDDIKAAEELAKLEKLAAIEAVAAEQERYALEVAEKAAATEAAKPKPIGVPIQATHTYWGGTSDTKGFLFVIEFKVVVTTHSGYYYSSKNEKEYNFADTYSYKCFWSINGIEMPIIESASSIEWAIAKEVNKFFGCDVADDHDFDGYFQSHVRKVRVFNNIDEMLGSIPAFDKAFEYSKSKVIRLDTTFDKETKCGTVRIATRKNFTI
jgi:hypothetical protein